MLDSLLGDINIHLQYVKCACSVCEIFEFCDYFPIIAQMHNIH